MTFKKTRQPKKQRPPFTLEKSKTNSKQIIKNRKNRKNRKNHKTSIEQQGFKSYASNDYYTDHPYFNILFGETDKIDIECPELLEDTYSFSLPKQENAENVKFSTLLKKVDDTMFKTVYTFI
jgi:hypothetical protein